LKFFLQKKISTVLYTNQTKRTFTATGSVHKSNQKHKNCNKLCTRTKRREELLRRPLHFCCSQKCKPPGLRPPPYFSFRKTGGSEHPRFSLRLTSPLSLRDKGAGATLNSYSQVFALILPFLQSKNENHLLIQGSGYSLFVIRNF
jgi:hypothetical protein